MHDPPSSEWPPSNSEWFSYIWMQSFRRCCTVQDQLVLLVWMNSLGKRATRTTPSLLTVQFNCIYTKLTVQFNCIYTNCMYFLAYPTQPWHSGLLFAYSVNFTTLMYTYICTNIERPYKEVFKLFINLYLNLLHICNFIVTSGKIFSLHFYFTNTREDIYVSHFI